MTEQELEAVLASIYPDQLQAVEPGVWQAETPTYRLLTLLSEDRSWLRLMIPIAPISAAEPFLRELLANNFDVTGEVRYALHQEALWVVFQHNFKSLVVDDCLAAIAQLISLQERGLKDPFDHHLDRQVSLIIRAAKKQGISLEMTLQNLDRFYEEGVMGDLDAGVEVRQATLAAWRERLERLWPTLDDDA